MAHAGGAPTKLTDELITSAQEYLNECETFASTMLPTIEGLALSLNVNRDTVYAWETDNINQQFSDIIKRLRSAQAQKLIQNSLQGRYNPMIAKLLLSKHGYVEKQEVDTNISGELKTGGMNPELAAEFTQFLKKKTEE